MSLPLLYYSGTIIWVDDDELFLRVVSQFFNEHFRISTFNSPEATIDFFCNYTSYLHNMNLSQGLTNSCDCSQDNAKSIYSNLEKIKKICHDQKRLSEIAIIIVDYNMPKINGIDLCRKLPSNIKKILLTGDTDTQKALSAQKEGIIDAFLLKDSSTIVSDLNNKIKSLSTEYFYETTKLLVDNLEIHNRSILFEPVFIKFFNDICSANEIKEFYLLDKNGNFLLKDKNNKQYYMIAHTDKTLNRFIELHNNDEMSTFTRAVQLREKIPFINENDWNTDLQNYFYTPNILDGYERYYWTFTIDPQFDATLGDNYEQCNRYV